MVRRQRVNAAGVTWVDEKPPIDYDAIAESYAAHRRASPKVLEHLTERLSQRQTGSLLEMGCGTADYLAVLAQRMKAPGVGFDKSTEMLRQGRRKHPGLTLNHADAEAAFPFDDNSFDLCFSVNLVHYLANLRAFFAEAYRVAKRPAVVVSVTDSKDDIRRRTVSEYFPETLEIELNRYPAIPQIVSAMEEAGWTGIELTHTERTFPLDSLILEDLQNKARSALRLIRQPCFEAGIARLKRDLVQGEVMMREVYTYVWGNK